MPKFSMGLSVFINFYYQIKRNVYGQMNGWLDGQHETYRDPNGFMLYKSIDAVKTRIENQVHKNHTKIDL